MELFESNYVDGDERFATPRTYHSGGQRANSVNSSTPRSVHSDDWKTASSRSMAPSALSDTAGYRTPRRQLEQEETGRRHGSVRSHTLSEISEAEPLDEKDVSDLFSYARHGRVDDITRSLARGMPVDTRDEIGNTMLIVACQNGNKRVVKLVLRNGANINVRNYKGNTPLHYCYHCKSGYIRSRPMYNSVQYICIYIYL